jgi:hypothetical protein
MTESVTLEEARSAALRAVQEAVRDGWRVIAAVGTHPSGTGYAFAPVTGAHDPRVLGEILEFVTPDGRRFLPVTGRNEV